jgi:hypothetical protein
VPEPNVKIYGPSDDDEFLAELGGYLTYVACIVIRKDLWTRFFRNEMVGTYFAHIDAICRAKIGRSAHFFPQPCISMRLHSQTWTARHFEIWNILFPAVIWQLNGYSEKAKGAVIPQHPIKSISRILASRAYGRFNLEIFRTVLLRSGQVTLFVKAASLLIALLPHQLFRWMYIIFIRVGRRKHSSGFSPSLALAQLGNAVK